MEETIRSTKLPFNRIQQRSEFVDDECSTDSGCSSAGSSGGSSGSAEHLSRSRNGDHESLSSHRHSGCDLHPVNGHHQNEPATTRSQERLSRSEISRGIRARSTEASRSWSPIESRCHMKISPSHSSSPSDAHSTDSDSSKKAPKTEILRRALQCLKLGKCENNECKEKKLRKKSPKRILREPVLYTYVRGLSGLPTQRVPRNTVQQLGIPCSCQEIISIRRHNPDRR